MRRSQKVRNMSFAYVNITHLTFRIDITPNTVTKTKFRDDPDQHLLADKQDPNNNFEVRQYHPTKISDFISLTFDAHKFFGKCSIQLIL